MLEFRKIRCTLTRFVTHTLKTALLSCWISTWKGCPFIVKLQVPFVHDVCIHLQLLTDSYRIFFAMLRKHLLIIKKQKELAQFASSFCLKYLLFFTHNLKSIYRRL